jgi:ABC-2 type transport system ATP-binding protein
MALLEARELTKVFRVPDKEPGLAAAVRQLYRRRYRQKVAVNGVDLSIEAGESVAYVGPNGAGKSTTVKLLTGILVPTRGEVRLDGIVPHRDRIENAHRIGVLFGQRTQLWWDLPVAETLDTLRDMYGIDRATFRRRMRRFDEVLDLGEILPTLGRRLSLGQRMRADLAAALSHAPQGVYLDEPTIGLDIAVKDRVREFLRTLRDEGTTLMLTSHDLQDIQGLCRRLVIIDDGRIIFDGSLTHLTDTYAQERLLRIQVAADVAVESLQQSLPGTTVTADDTRLGYSIRFNRFTTTAGQVVSALAPLVDLVDFHVDEPNIEDVIRRVYSGELLAEASR